MRQNNREHHTLSEADFPAAIATDFLFEKGIQGPLNVFAKVLREEQPYFNCVRKRFLFSEKRLRFTFLQWCGRTFVMQNMAHAEFVLDEDRRVERNLVPIRQSIARLYAKRPLLTVSPKCFDAVFKRDAKSIRETDFYFLRKGVIGAIEAKGVALVNQSGEDGPGWQNIGVDEI